MMLRYLMMTLALWTTTGAYAQEKPSEGKPIEPFQYWAVKLPLANLVDIWSSPNLQVGIERRFDKHNCVQLIAAGCIDADGSGAPNGFKTKAEYRRYFRLRPRRRQSFYLAAELEYIQTSQQVDQQYMSMTTGDLYTDRFHFFQQKYGCNLKFGFHKELRRHFMFDAWAGLGIRHVIAVQKGRTNPNDPIYEVRAVDMNIHSSGRYLPYNGNDLSMPVNFAFGYRFH